MPHNRLSINVLDTSVTIGSPEGTEYLNKLLDKLRNEIEKTKKLTGLDDPLKTAILACFSLCDENEKLKSSKRISDFGNFELGDGSSEIENIALSMISRLDEVLDPDNSIGTGKTPQFFKLRNTVKNYQWGSAEWLPAMLGKENPGREPWAEFWMGVHPEGPSRIDGFIRRKDIKGGKATAGSNDVMQNALLSEFISESPLYCLGEDVKSNFGGLPFLFKIIAAEKPLSIQAHPRLDQAREGWERENTKGITLDSPSRNYKDPNHKPEIICALTPFTAMSGFRETAEIAMLLEEFSRNSPVPVKQTISLLISALDSRESPIKTFLHALFEIDDAVKRELCAFALTGRYGTSVPQYSGEWNLVSRLAKFYPSDAAVLSPLYLNLIELNPGEAIYLPAGVLHAYVYGLGIELMANSDNVLRGGLTTKHIDREELFRVVNFYSFKPSKTRVPEIISKTEGFSYTYPVFCREFSLTMLCGGSLDYPIPGASIILVTSGEMNIIGTEQKLKLRKGETAFIPAGEASGSIRLSGDFAAYAASPSP